jgi:hypothetical protein
MSKIFTIGLDAELRRRAKREAALQGRTLNSLIEEGLRRILTPQSEAISSGLPERPSAAAGR